jgi:hypothetical protein
MRRFQQLPLPLPSDRNGSCTQRTVEAQLKIELILFHERRLGSDDAGALVASKDIPMLAFSDASGQSAKRFQKLQARAATDRHGV